MKKIKILLTLVLVSASFFSFKNRDLIESSSKIENLKTLSDQTYRVIVTYNTDVITNEGQKEFVRNFLMRYYYGHFIVERCHRLGSNQEIWKFREPIDPLDPIRTEPVEPIQPHQQSWLKAVSLEADFLGLCVR